MQQIFNHPSTLYRNLDAQGAASKRTAAGYDSMDDFVVTPISPYISPYISLYLPTYLHISRWTTSW